MRPNLMRATAAATAIRSKFVVVFVYNMRFVSALQSVSSFAWREVDIIMSINN